MRTHFAPLSLLLLACGGASVNEPAHSPISGAPVNIGPGSPQATGPQRLAKGDTVLPAEMPLGPWVPLFERGVMGGYSSQTSDPVMIDADQIAVLSFGRRIIVTGKTARIIDRADNPEFEEMAPVPETAGGGFILFAKERASYVKTFDAEPIPLRTPHEVSGTQLMFGPHSVLFVDNMNRGSDDEEDGPDTYAYASLTDGAPLPFPLTDVQMFVGTPDGRALAMNRDGELFYAAKLEQPFRKLSLPRVNSIQAEGSELQVGDEQGAYALDAALSRDRMPPVTATASQFNYPSPAGSSWNLRSGRLLDATTLGVPQGEEMSLTDLQGTEQRKTYPITAAGTPGTKGRRGCEYLSTEGPLFVQCRGMRENGEPTLSIHLYDPVKKAGKVDKVLPLSRERGHINVLTGPAGLPAYFTKCDGQMDGTTACLRNKDGAYKDIDMRRALIAAGIVDPNQPIKYALYHTYSTPLLPNEAGNAAAVLGLKNEEAVMGFSDGRTRTFDVKGYPRRFRSIFRMDEATSWFMGERVVGIIGPRGGYRRAVMRTMGGRRAKPGRSLAVAYSIPIQGEISVRAFDGYLGRAGAKVLRINAEGTGVEESQDLGQTFKTVAAPPGLRVDPKNYDWDNEDFCGETACRVGPWVRMGWGK